MNRSLLLVALLFTSSMSVYAQSFKQYQQSIPNSTVKFTMVPIPAGSFTMGSPADEKGRDADEGPQKVIQISAFWMGATEVTFAEWDLFFKNLDIPQTKEITVDAVSRPTAQYIDLTWGMGRDPKNAANSMSQQAAIMYCKWLYEQTGIFYRLPTEAEWEYACRAGSKTAFPFGNNAESLSQYGHYAVNSGDKYHKTAELKPNAWGLYDMLGNLSEWTLDQYKNKAYEDLSNNAKDPVVPPGSRYPRVVRGGSYMDQSKELRCANRIPSSADWNQRDPQIPKSKWWLTDGMFVGFRVVRPLKQPSKEEINKFFEAYLR